MQPDSIVFGAAGFTGRFLVAELLRRGHAVAAAARSGGERLTSWLADQGVSPDGLTVVRADITRPGLGLPAEADLSAVRDVYNCAGRYAFGLTTEEARATNVTGALHILDWAAGLAKLRRVVHISGYRVGVAKDPRGLGAYEASKVEADAAVRARARDLDLPLSIANPASVIGPGQFVGLADVVSDLWHGRLPAVPGGREVFVPVVEAGHFAAFMANLPEHDQGRPGAYWVLDDRTPVLPELVELLAGHMGVRAPRRTVPVGLLRLLPRALTGVNPETLSFLSAERYDTAPADAFAERTGLRPPPVEKALTAWADDLVAARFGQASAPRGPYGYRRVAGVATWVEGELERPGYVLLHGLPLDSGSWAEVRDRLDSPTLAADLPGLGRSGPAGGRLAEGGIRSSPNARPAGDGTRSTAWLAELLRPAGTRPVLVAHSLACIPAIHYAAAHPDRVSRLVLVAPAFLQAPSSRLLRSAAATPLLRRMSARRLAGALGVPESPAVTAAAAGLARPGAARRVVAAMRAAHAGRDGLRRALDRVRVPVEIVVGSADPLTAPVDRPVTTIDGPGHYPQLTHPGELAAVITG